MSPAAAPLAQATALFQSHFGASPEVAVQAPGRVNLIGEHTDYNDGFALPCAIDFHTVVVGRPRRDGQVHVVAQGHGGRPETFAVAGLGSAAQPVQWVDYVKAMVWAWTAQGLPFEGADWAIAGNVPQGSGLSSSAALEVALGVMLRTLAGSAQPQATPLALMAQRAENEFVGCHCGNMDQLASAHGVQGHALLLDCRSLALSPVPLPAQAAVVIIDSKVRRGLVDSEYNTRRQQCEAVAQALGVKALRDLDLATLEAKRAQLDPVAFKRARHVVTENARTLDAAQALARGDLRALAGLMAASHASLRDDFEVTVPPIDRIVGLVGRVLPPEGGVRMTGGGFGGCVVAVVPQASVDAVKAVLAQHYRSPQGEAAEVYVCGAQAGAAPLNMAALAAGGN